MRGCVFCPELVEGQFPENPRLPPLSSRGLDSPGPRDLLFLLGPRQADSSPPGQAGVRNDRGGREIRTTQFPYDPVGQTFLSVIPSAARDRHFSRSHKASCRFLDSARTSELARSPGRGSARNDRRSEAKPAFNAPGGTDILACLEPVEGSVILSEAKDLKLRLWIRRPPAPRRGGYLSCAILG